MNETIYKDSEQQKTNKTPQKQETVSEGRREARIAQEV